MSREHISIILAFMIPVIGVLGEVLRRSFKLRGYRALAGDVRFLAQSIKGEIDRDAQDLLVRGNVDSWPVMVRLSRSEMQPGLNIRLPVPAKLSLFCVPKSHEREGGRVLLHVPEPKLEGQWRISTDDPLEAELLVTNPAVLKQIETLCSSPNTLLVLQEQALELRDALIPQRDLGPHILSCARALARIADVAATMPGASARPAPYAPRNWFRAAYVGLSIVLLSSVIVMGRMGQPVNPPLAASVPLDIPSTEAAQIRDLGHWRLAQSADFDPDGVLWLRQQGQEASGRITAFCKDGAAQESMLIFKDAGAAGSGPRRLILLVDGQIRFDAEMPTIAVAARIPKDKLADMEWRGRGPVGPAECDGILIVQRYNAPGSAVVLIPCGVQLHMGNPQDFRSLPLQ